MAALSFAVSACENNRDNALPGATACFLAEGVLESAPFYVVDEDPAVTLRVFRSGYYAESLTVSVRSSESALETYNSENATAYKALPQSAYRIEPERITLAGDERSGAFQVIFDPMQLVGVEDPENLVVPVELLSDGNVSAKRNILLVHPNLEQIAVEIDEAATLFYITGENTYVNNAANAWDQTLTLKLARPFEADGTVALDCRVPAGSRRGRYVRGRSLDDRQGRNGGADDDPCRSGQSRRRTLRRARSSDLRLFRGRSREEHLPAALRPDDSGELFADQPLRMAVRNHPFCQFEQRYADDRRQAGYLLGRSVQTRRQHDQSHGCRCTAVQLQIGFALRYRDLCRGFAGARLSGQAYRCRLYRSLFG